MAQPLRTMPANRLAGLVSLLAVALIAAGCGGFTEDADKDSRGETIKIGFIADLSGVQRSLGTLIRNGLDLYIERNGGKLGGHPVKIVVADESDNPKAAQKAVEGLMKRKDLVAVTGIMDVRTAFMLSPMLKKAKLPAVSSLACTDQAPDLSYLWCVVHLTSHHGTPLGGYVADRVGRGGVYVLGTDLGPAKADTISFVKTFKPAGGRIANGQPAFVPYSAKVSYQAHLDEAVRLGAEAIYVWATGLQAVTFVKEYRAHEASEKIPVYAAGPLTCCDLLGLQGEAALGVYSSLDYTVNLDNDANREFVVAYQQEHGRAPSEPAVYGYSSALVLDQAISAAKVEGKRLTGEDINKALDSLGVIEDPRGSWVFNKDNVATPKFYLRQVQWDGSALTNVLVTELTTPGLEA